MKQAGSLAKHSDPTVSLDVIRARVDKLRLTILVIRILLFNLHLIHGQPPQHTRYLQQDAQKLNAQGGEDSGIAGTAQSSPSDTKTAIEVQNVDELITALKEISALGDDPLDVVLRLAAGEYHITETLYLDLRGRQSGGSLSLEGAGTDNTLLLCDAHAVIAGLAVDLSREQVFNITIRDMQLRGCATALSVHTGFPNPPPAPHPPAPPTSSSPSFIGPSSVFLISLTLSGNHNPKEGVGAAAFSGLSSLHILDCTFTNNSALTGIQSNITNDSPPTLNAGALLATSIRSLTFEGLTFTGNSVSSLSNTSGSGALLVSKFQSTSITTTTMLNNSSPLGCGGATFQQVAAVQISNSNFSRHECPGDSCTGAIFITSLSNALGNATGETVLGVVNITQSNFTDNIVTGILSVGSLRVKDMIRVIVKGCHFVGNEATGDLSQGGMQVYNVESAMLWECQGDRCISDGTLSIQVLEILSDTELKGKCLNPKKLGPRNNCNLPGVKDVFEDNIGACDPENQRKTMAARAAPYGCGGAALMIFNSHTVMFNSTFSNTTATPGACPTTDLGYRTLRTKWPELYISLVERVAAALPTAFVNNSGLAGGAVWMHASSFSVSFWRDTRCTAQLPEQRKVVFRDNQCFSGGAIVAHEPQSVHIVNTRFINNSASTSTSLLSIFIGWEQSIGVYPQEPFYPDVMALVLSNTTTWSCGAGNGGAVCIVSPLFVPAQGTGGDILAIASSSFENNSATYGGAVYLTSNNEACRDQGRCSILYVTGIVQHPENRYFTLPDKGGDTLTEDTGVEFKLNVALDGGGGASLYYEDPTQILVLLQECASWYGNEAIGGFGPTLATSPMSLDVEFAAGQDTTILRGGEVIYITTVLRDVFGQEHLVSAHNANGLTKVELDGSSFNASTGLELESNTFYVDYGRDFTGRLPSSKLGFLIISSPGDVKFQLNATLSAWNRLLVSWSGSFYVRPCNIDESLSADGKQCLSIPSITEEGEGGGSKLIISIVIPIAVGILLLGSLLFYFKLQLSHGLLKYLTRHRFTAPGVGSSTTLLITDIESSSSLWEMMPELRKGGGEATPECSSSGTSPPLAIHQLHKKKLPFVGEDPSNLPMAKISLPEDKQNGVPMDWRTAMVEEAEPMYASVNCSPGSTFGTEEKDYLMWRGLRVRMGMHSGVRDASNIVFNRTSGSAHYGGEFLALANAVQGAAHGGMVLCSAATFQELHLRDMSSLCVAHVGEHILEASREEVAPNSRETAEQQSVRQSGSSRSLTKALAYKRGDALHVYQVMGLQLSQRCAFIKPINSHEQLSGDFLTAPCQKGTVCFMNVCGAESLRSWNADATKRALALFQRIAQQPLKPWVTCHLPPATTQALAHLSPATCRIPTSETTQAFGHLSPATCRLPTSETTQAFGHLSPATCRIPTSETTQAFGHLSPATCRTPTSETTQAFGHLSPATCRIPTSETTQAFGHLSPATCRIPTSETTQALAHLSPATCRIPASATTQAFGHPSPATCRIPASATTQAFGHLSLWHLNLSQHHCDFATPFLCSSRDALNTCYQSKGAELKRYNGYLLEMTDGLCLTSFTHPADAVRWALSTIQVCLDAPWEPALLENEMNVAALTVCQEISIPVLSHEPTHEHGLMDTQSYRYAEVATQLLFRGLRLKCGMDHGPLKSLISSASGRMEHRGRVMNRAARIGSQARAGAVLCSQAVWAVAEKTVNHLIEQANSTRLSNYVIPYHALAPNDQFGEALLPCPPRMTQDSGFSSSTCWRLSSEEALPPPTVGSSAVNCTFPLGLPNASSSAVSGTSPLGLPNASSSAVSGTSPLGLPNASSSAVNGTAPLGLPKASSSAVNGTAPLGLPNASSSAVNGTAPLGLPNASSSAVSGTSPLGLPNASSSAVNGISPLSLPNASSSAVNGTSHLGIPNARDQISLVHTSDKPCAMPQHPSEYTKDQPLCMKKVIAIGKGSEKLKGIMVS
eukprot:gene12495-15709_t